MRIRVAAAVVSGAVVLSALALPVAAQAAERTGAAVKPSFLASKAVQPRDSLGNTKFSHAVVNGGKDIVLGTTGTKSVTVTFTATDASGVALT
jgi:hypothetical protein